MGTGRTLSVKIIEHPVHGTLVYNLARTQKKCMIRLLKYFTAVGNEEYRGSLGFKFPYDRKDMLNGVDIYTAVRFIHEEEPGFHGIYRGKLDPFSFAAGEGLVHSPGSVP